MSQFVTPATPFFRLSRSENAVHRISGQRAEIQQQGRHFDGLGETLC